MTATILRDIVETLDDMDLIPTDEPVNIIAVVDEIAVDNNNKTQVTLSSTTQLNIDKYQLFISGVPSFGLIKGKLSLNFLSSLYIYFLGGLYL